MQIRKLKAWIDKYILRVNNPKCEIYGYFYEWDYLKAIKKMPKVLGKAEIKETNDGIILKCNSLLTPNETRLLMGLKEIKHNEP